MMQSLRKQAKGFLAFILFGLLILSFAIWGIGDIFRPTTARTVVIEVAGQKVAARTLLDQVQRDIRRFQARTGVALDSSQALQLGLVNQTVGRLVGTMLLDAAARDLGVAISNRVLSEAVRTDPAFQNQFGKFDRDLYRRTLTSQGLSERGFEEILRGDLGRLQLTGAVSDVEKAPKALVAALYAYRHERRVADVAVIRNESIVDVGTPDDDALAEFHKTHAAEFTAPEYRKAVAVIVRPDDLAKDIAVADEELRREYEYRLDEFTRPERRTVEQILLTDKAAADAAYERIAKGEDFAQVAKDVSGEPPVSLGTVTRKDLPFGELAEAVFSLAQGEASRPVRTSLGWHILRVSAIQKGGTQPFEEAREKLAADLRKEKAVDAAIKLSEDLDKEIGGGATLEEAATRLNLPLVRIEAIDSRGRDREGRKVEGLPSGPEFLSQIFELGEGEDSLLTEADDGSYFIVRVDKITPAALRPLESIRDKVIAAWTAARRSEMAQERAEALAKAVREGADMAARTAKMGLSVETVGPFTRDGRGADDRLSPALIRKLFAARAGDAVAGPVPGGHAAAVLKKIEKANPLADSQEVQKVAEDVRRAIAGDLLAQFSNALRERYEVDVDEDAIRGLFAQR